MLHLPQTHGQLLGGDDAHLGRRDHARDQLLQLAQIAGPVIRLEHAKGVVGQLDQVGVEQGIRRLAREELHQRRDVLDAFPQRWQHDRQRGDAIEKLVVKVAFIGQAFEVLARRTDKAEPVGSVAKNGHQLLLHGHRQALQMLKEEGTALRLIDPGSAASVLSK